MSRLYKPRSGARTEGGLIIPLHATLRGSVRWQTLDERGVPEIPRNESGFALGPIDGVEQPNLITDVGLDSIAAYNLFGTLTSVTTGWRHTLAIGTSSVAPDVTDTALGAEVQRGAGIGSYPEPSDLIAGGLDDDRDVWYVDSGTRRLITMTADRNLTEFGFFPGTLGAGNCAIRELFRDGGGSPVTISLLNGKQILVTHNLRVELPAPAAGLSGSFDIDEYDAANALIASTSYTWTGGWYIDSLASSPNRVSGNSTNTAGSFIAQQPNIFGIWQPGGTVDNEIGVCRMPSDKAYARILGGFASGDTDPSNTTGTLPSTFSWSGYTAGTYQRLRRSTVPTASLNGAWYGWILRGSGSSARSEYCGFMVNFGAPSTYTKASTDTLRVGLLSTWARAPIGS